MTGNVVPDDAQRCYYVSREHPEVLLLAVVVMFVLFWVWPEAPSWVIVAAVVTVSTACWLLLR
jgi:hypothetical protein